VLVDVEWNAEQASLVEYSIWIGRLMPVLEQAQTLTLLYENCEGQKVQMHLDLLRRQQQQGVLGH
jgi:hypothetical protein